LKYSTEGLRSKSWDEFARPDSPVFDFIFTVCDKAAGEACPVWPGHPATAHWGVTDPAAYVGPEEKQRAVFMKAYMELDTRIKLFLNLPPRFHRLDVAETAAGRYRQVIGAGRARGGGLERALPPPRANAVPFVLIRPVRWSIDGGSLSGLACRSPGPARSTDAEAADPHPPGIVS
jgi:hypothetical protein